MTTPMKLNNQYKLIKIIFVFEE